MSEVGLLRPALSGHEDANALDHLGGRACAFGQKDVGAGSAIEGVDSTGDNHGRQAGLKLFGAPDKFVAVHLRHDQVTEKKIQRAGSCLLDNFKRLL